MRPRVVVVTYEAPVPVKQRALFLYTLRTYRDGSKMNIRKTLFLTDNDVRQVLTFKDTLEKCDNVFRWMGEEKVQQEPGRHIYIEPEKGKRRSLFTYGPAFIEPMKALGVKVNGGSYVAVERSLPFINGAIVLFDWMTLEVLAFMDECCVTSLRTGGHAGVGAKYLARKNSSVIAVIGCGVEGRSHLCIMNELFKIDEVRTFARRSLTLDRYEKEMGEQLGLSITKCKSAKEAVRGADVICMCTTARETLVFDDWIEPGTHVCGTTGFSDLDPKFSKTADKWVLGWHGDLLGVERDPRLSKEDVYAFLTEVVIGKKFGRKTDKERTVMTCGGIGALDVAVAQIAYEKAKEKGLGIELKMR